MSISNIDFTNTNQKIFAGGIIAGILVLLHFLLPPLVVIFANIWLMIAMAVPLVFGIMNHQLIWGWAKQLSWALTKWTVSTDKLGYMYRYHEYLLERIGALNKSVESVGAMRVKLQRRIGDLKETIESDKKQAIEYGNRNAPQTVIRSIGNKVTINTKQLETLLPRAVEVTNNEKYLRDLYDNWKADAEDLKFTLDAKAEEYKLLKELNDASETAGEFLNGNSQEYKIYQESLRQIEDSAVQYISNIQNFERKAQPFLENLAVGRAVSEDEGLKLIEEYKKNSVNLKIES